MEQNEHVSLGAEEIRCFMPEDSLAAFQNQVKCH
jgi:hypothetical protein